MASVVNTRTVPGGRASARALAVAGHPTDLHRDTRCLLPPVPEDAQPGVDAPGLEVDRVGRLGIGFQRDHMRPAGGSVDDQLAESPVESEAGIRPLVLVDQPAEPRGTLGNPGR